MKRDVAAASRSKIWLEELTKKPGPEIEPIAFELVAYGLREDQLTVTWLGQLRAAVHALRVRGAK
jgi:hypothetical protein